LPCNGCGKAGTGFERIEKCVGGSGMIYYKELLRGVEFKDGW